MPAGAAWRLPFIEHHSRGAAMPKTKTPSTAGSGKRPAAVDRAHRVPGRAPTTQAVSSAAERLGSDDDGTMQASDWMAERQVGKVASSTAGAAPVAQPEGTPITSPKHDAARTGRARESRRGSQY
jgi:hypothetical protein